MMEREPEQLELFPQETTAATPKPKITGYRELTDNEIADINMVKGEAENVEIVVDYMKHAGPYDHRWIAIAQTHLQQGFMALTRAIARPTSF